MIKDKKILSWAFYDWANSAYATTVMAGFFPLFFQKYWSTGIEPAVTTARLGSAISLASLVVALCSPFLGAVADLRSYKKTYLFIFMLIGVLCCVGMFFVPQGDWMFALTAYAISMMAFNASCVFNDSLLPYVAEGRRLDYASSVGYALGYLGGGILFLLNVIMFLKPELFGIAGKPEAVKWSFLTVGVWWLVFTIPLMRNVPEPKSDYKEPFMVMMKQSMNNLFHTLRAMVKNRNILFFVVGYWFYIDGVYTVMTMAVDYGVSIGLEGDSLMTALLMTQFIGFPFAWLFGMTTGRWGLRKPILFCIGCYSVAVILATQMSTALHFYLLAAMIGMVQGGVQALSRSFFAQMIPREASGEYFGVFNLVGKFASILGPFIVGMTVYMTGEHRFGMLGLLVLFMIGGGLLFKVKELERA
ncbi:MFS transporter [Bdellovibrio sp. HCB337]|uniref:MFS transporter n=1 Tax=Bdellovibrio sp. HCB337 TaxID=3394358 RepID=UPI0039A49137